MTGLAVLVVVAGWMVFVAAAAAVAPGHHPLDPRRRAQPARGRLPDGGADDAPERRRARWLGGRRRRRSDRRRSEAVIAEAVPDVIDLFAVAIASGLNTRLALRAVAERAPPGPLTDALRRVERHVATTGARLADTVERLPEELGTESVRPLTAAITDAERYGAALATTLDRLADDARRTRQRRAEEQARRIPVKLLFPLVTCILPAFGLLTVAPLIAGGLRALRL